jgi:peptidoglycan/LPS O-acetylase OafA/YrhL
MEKTPRADERVPALDGIRGLAVCLVMVSHFALHGGMQASNYPLDRMFLRLTSSAWIGVDLFFVMSGFLITSILWNSREKEGYFRVFYARRILRIFPLYFAYLAVRLLILPGIYPELALIPGRQILFWTYTSNTIPILSHFTDAFGAARPGPGLFHFWSLAVEEQFYFVWPFLVWKLNRRQMLRLCAALIVLTPLTRMLLRFLFEPEAAYVFSLGRVDALALGAYCAIALDTQREQLRAWAPRVLLTTVPLLAVIFVARGRLGPSDIVMQSVGYTAVAFTAAALLIRALDRPGIFGWKWLQGLGFLCYGLYVFNGPLGHFMGKLIPVMSLPSFAGSYLPAQGLALVAGLAVNVAIAWVVWHTFEKRFNSLKSRFRHGRVLREEPVLAPSAAPALSGPQGGE